MVVLNILYKERLISSCELLKAVDMEYDHYVEFYLININYKPQLFRGISFCLKLVWSDFRKINPSSHSYSS